MSIKTASLKQLFANRLNAMKSTGPKTEEGKERSKMNGQRHGLTGKAMLMIDEDRAVYEAFTERIIESLQPANPLEQNFAYLIAQAHHRLNRVHAIEENTFALGHYNQAANFEADHPEVHAACTQARVFDLKGDLFKNLSLYEQRIAREMHRNMKALKELQDQRKAEERLATLEASKPKVRTAAASGTSEQNGFGFSSAQTPQPAPVEAPPFEGKKAA